MLWFTDILKKSGKIENWKFFFISIFGKIEIKSDGTPWRPTVHVRDVSNAYIAGLEAPKNLITNRSFNVGIQGGNYTVRELAEVAQKLVPGSTLSFTGEHGIDSRTYKVGFKRILTELRDYFKPEHDNVYQKLL